MYFAHEDLGSKEAVLKVQRDFRTAGLSARDVEKLNYADKIAQNASQVSQEDIDCLREVGIHRSANLRYRFMRSLALLRRSFL